MELSKSTQFAPKFAYLRCKIDFCFWRRHSTPRPAPSGERDTHPDIPLSSRAPSTLSPHPTHPHRSHRRLDPRPYGTRTRVAPPFANPGAPLFGSRHFFSKETIPDYGCGLHSAVIHTTKIVFFFIRCAVLRPI